MTGIELFAAVASTALGAAAAAKQASSEQEAAKYKAQQDALAAGEARVEGQQKAQAQLRKEQQVLSKEQSLIGASGGGGGGTAAEIEADTTSQGSLNQELELWQGNEKSQGFKDDASLELYKASQSKAAEPLAIGSQIVGGIGKIGKIGGASIPTYDSLIDSSSDPDSGWKTNTYRTNYRYGGGG